MTMRIARGPDGEVRHTPAPFVPPPPKGRKKRVAPDPIKTNGESGPEQLRLFLERIERLEEEKRGIADDIADVFSEAKATGFDTKTMRTILKLRMMETHHRAEAEELLETYLESLGMR
jgi:uncharacterized protein (UPF0335 family)